MGDYPRAVGLSLEDADAVSFGHSGFTAGLRDDRPAVRVVIDRQLADGLDFLIGIAIEVHGVLIEKLTHELAQFRTTLGRFVWREEDGVLTEDIEEGVDVAAVHRLHHVLADGSDRFHV